MLDYRTRPVSTKDHSVMKSEMTRVVVEYIFMFHGVNRSNQELCIHVGCLVTTLSDWSSAPAKHPNIVL